MNSAYMLQNRQEVHNFITKTLTMKKLLYFISLIIIFSCTKKDEPRCWTCEEITTVTMNPPRTGFPKTEYKVEAVCDFNEEGIRKYEKSRTDTIFYGGGQTNYVVTTCK